jgi:hypothetical protein
MSSNIEKPKVGDVITFEYTEIGEKKSYKITNATIAEVDDDIFSLKGYPYGYYHHSAKIVSIIRNGKSSRVKKPEAYLVNKILIAMERNPKPCGECHNKTKRYCENCGCS